VYPQDAASGELAGTVSITKPGGAKTLMADGIYDSYRWLVDGKIMAASPTYTLKASEYRKGNHQLSLEVTRNGEAYSKSGFFTVN
jgi:hypothetical protein